MVEIQEAYSPSQERINKLIQYKEDKEKGILNGIPLWERFPQLGEFIPTLDKGQVILNCAASGVGSYLN